MVGWGRAWPTPKSGGGGPRPLVWEPPQFLSGRLPKSPSRLWLARHCVEGGLPPEGYLQHEDGGLLGSVRGDLVSAWARDLSQGKPDITVTICGMRPQGAWSFDLSFLDNKLLKAGKIAK